MISWKLEIGKTQDKNTATDEWWSLFAVSECPPGKLSQY